MLFCVVIIIVVCCYCCWWWRCWFSYNSLLSSWRQQSCKGFKEMCFEGGVSTTINLCDGIVACHQWSFPRLRRGCCGRFYFVVEVGCRGCAAVFCGCVVVVAVASWLLRLRRGCCGCAVVSRSCVVVVAVALSFPVVALLFNACVMVVAVDVSCCCAWLSRLRHFVVVVAVVVLCLAVVVGCCGGHPCHGCFSACCAHCCWLLVGVVNNSCCCPTEPWLFPSPLFVFNLLHWQFCFCCCQS